MTTFLFWFLLIIGGALFLAYRRLSLRAATVAAGVALVVYTLAGSHPLPWLVLLWAGFAASCASTLPISSIRCCG